jgi:DNA-binding winged helix-turn-helix (wHTH) protein
MNGPSSPSTRQPATTSEDRLDSWKEIAVYLKRDVTTVRRWERREGMPVHRHVHDKLGSVYAFRTELDAWTRGRNLSMALDEGGGDKTLAFGGHRLDLGSRQLFRGSAEIHLPPKAFDLLQLLVEKRPQALSKAEIHDCLWPGTFVTEATLASLIAELRRALDDDPRAPRFVRTLHGFGYAFCGHVDTEETRPASATSCWIVWRSREIPLDPGENIIGRDPEVAVRVDFPSVSRRHARIVVSPNGATIEDLGSKNGTLVRGDRVAGILQLADLDDLQVGSVQMTFRSMRGVEPTETIGGH